MRRPQTHFPLRRFALLAGVLATGLPCPAAAVAEEALSPPVAVDSGRALFLGHATDGEPAPRALLRGSSASVPATRFACANCHGRDGRGLGEGSLRAPSIRWQDLKRASPQRSAGYDGNLFRRAIAEGADPDGRPLDRLMPGYSLSEPQLRSLIAYLEFIDDDQRIGIESGAIRIGVLAQGPGDDFPAALARAFAQMPPIFGRQVELVSLDGADTNAAERARIFAAVGLPNSSRRLWPELSRLGIANLFPRALLDGDESEAETIGLLPVLDEIGRAALDRGADCAKAPLTIAVSDHDPVSRRLAAAAVARAAVRPALPAPNVHPMATLLRGSRPSSAGDDCLLVFATPEEIRALVSSSPPRRYVGLVDQFALVLGKDIRPGSEFILADPRIIGDRPMDMEAFVARITEEITQALRSPGRQVSRASFMAALSSARRSSVQPRRTADQGEPHERVVFRRIVDTTR